MKELRKALSVCRESPGVAMMLAAYAAFGLIILKQGLDWLFGLFAH